MVALKNSLRELLRYPTAIIGLVIIFFLVAVSIYALVTIPYQEAIRLWRGGENVWYQNPKHAPPSWMNLFSDEKQPVSFAVSTEDGTLPKTVTPGNEDTATVEMAYSFDYTYDALPQEMILI